MQYHFIYTLPNIWIPSARESCGKILVKQIVQWIIFKSIFWHIPVFKGGWKKYFYLIRSSLNNKELIIKKKSKMFDFVLQ